MRTRVKRLADQPAIEETPKSPPKKPRSAKKVDKDREVNGTAVVKTGAKKKGGVRPGAGRPPYLKPASRKKNSAYVSLTDSEKEMLEEKAARNGLTLSYFIRDSLGLSK